MSPLIPPILALAGLLSLSTGVALVFRDNHQRTTLLARQGDLIAQQVMMLEGRDRDVAERDKQLADRDKKLERKDLENRIMGTVVRTFVARLREVQDGSDVPEAMGVADGGVVASAVVPSSDNGVVSP